MTFNQLKTEVTSLGFDTVTNNDTLLITSANRALRDIFSRKRITKTVRLYNRGASPTYHKKVIHCVNGKKITLPLKGAAFSMRVCGSGNYTVKDGTSLVANSFDTGSETKLIRGFIIWGGTIEFWGSFSFYVYDFSIYDEVFSLKQTDIPEAGDKTVIDVRKLYGDFMSFMLPPKSTSGEVIPDCVLRDGKLEIDSKRSGEIILTYRRLPTAISGTDKEEEIDIPDEFSHLLPLLTASYFCLDSDPDKAIYYRERYEDMLKSSSEHYYEDIDCNYVNVNGWA